MDHRRLTDVQASVALQVAQLPTQQTDTSVRAIPYIERYRGATAVMKTPLQQLQELTDPAIVPAAGDKP